MGKSGGEAPQRREEPVGGFGWSWDGRWWLVGVTVAAVEGWLGGGGAPVAIGRKSRALEIQWSEAKLVVPRVWAR